MVLIRSILRNPIGEASQVINKLAGEIRPKVSYNQFIEQLTMNFINEYE